MNTKIFHLILFMVSLNLYAQDWQTDFNKAQELAIQNNQKLILVFSGSDWCTPCIKLEKEIWDSEVFKNYAQEHYVMYKADFPRKKANKLPKEIAKKNAAVAEKYNHSGYFPLVVIINPAGEVIGNIGYENIKPEAYIELINSF